MVKLNQKQQNIISVLLVNGVMSSSLIHSELLKRGEDISLITIQRALAELVTAGCIVSVGAGRATTYVLTTEGKIFADIDAAEYCKVEPDRRFGAHGYNFDLLRQVPGQVLDDDARGVLEAATRVYTQRTTDLPIALQKKELERLVIELSWKSSKIEGNTYTLLDTEKLLLEQTEALGHPKAEAQMILNHKEAFTFVYEKRSLFVTLTKANLEHLHSLVVQGMGVGTGLRSRPVGITGSTY